MKDSSAPKIDTASGLLSIFIYSISVLEKNKRTCVLVIKTLYMPSI